MRLKFGTSARIVLSDGTTFVGTICRSWRWRVIKLTQVTTLTRDGEISADGFMLVPTHSVLFVQVSS